MVPEYGFHSWCSELRLPLNKRTGSLRRANVSGAAAADVSDITKLPPRLSLAEVLALARYSAATLRRRQKAGRFPLAVEQGVFLKKDVLLALGLSPTIENPDNDTFERAADAFHQDRRSTQRRKSPS